MDLFNKEEPTLAPVAAAPVAAPASKSVVECTRDTRGDAPCAVSDCENCN